MSSYTTNSSNEMTTTSNASYTYDYNGNTTSKTDSSGTTDYSWDYENRMTSVTLPASAGTVTFKYDPFGRRIEKISPSATSIFAYDGDNLVEEANSSGTEVASYTQTQNIDEPLAMLRGTTKSFYEADGLGSITSLSNSSGSLAQTYTYDSFGNQTASSGSLTNFFRYTGREFDTETGLYYYRTRYYDASAGRFLNEDPIQFAGGLDFYGYVFNGPTDLDDPLGLCPTTNRKPFWQCMADGANQASLAALLPKGTPPVISNLLSNDFSTVQQLVLGPGRLSALISVGEGRGLNAIGHGIGAIPYGIDRFILTENGAGTTYALDMIEGKVANTGLGVLVAAVSEGKLFYDAGSYAAGLLTCPIWGR